MKHRGRNRDPSYIYERGVLPHGEGKSCTARNPHALPHPLLLLASTQSDSQALPWVCTSPMNSNGEFSPGSISSDGQLQ